MNIYQLIFIVFAFILTLIIGFLLGFRFGKNLNREQNNFEVSLRNKQSIKEVENTNRSLRDIIIAKMEQLQQKTNVDFVALAIYDVMTDEIRWRLAIGASNERYKRIVIRMGKGIAGEVVQLNRIIKIENFPYDAIGDSIEYPIILIEHLRSVLAVPVSFQQKIYGVLLIGQRTERVFEDIDEQETKNVGQEIAKELERANIYDRILHEADLDKTQSLDQQLYQNDFIQYLLRKQKDSNKEKKGKIEFEVLDQSIVEITNDVQQTLVYNMEEIFTILNQNKDDQTNVSIGREGNYLLIEFKSNHSILSTKETFGQLYERIGQIGGSVISYREEGGFHLVMQVPVWSYQNPL
ncbi:GAF domain-containing protein [Tepidibacillus fermentans]|uniref:Nitrogen regulatory protein A n=1 Tax=Tepidibacillus fermentans TaxID=1281767 RepID=A0A4R3KLR2_9BACI|nr:GAF domain-containing protein [Tepidibacillus fermentans]TCS84542.1 nitrogen regulatory protein A [Tepidibacillus fermentans]